MTKPLSILLLAGSSEARQISAELLANGIQVRAISSEPPRGQSAFPVSVELMRQPNPKSLIEMGAGADAILDASHGFDFEMSNVAAAVACELELPFACFQRPDWSTEGRPTWQRAEDVRQAMALVRPGARVFSATGWASLPDCRDFPGERILLRQTTLHQRSAPYDFVELVFGDPPFSVAGEEDLFRTLKVDTLICRNLGGAASRPKLDAAANLGVDVILVDRPPLPNGVTVFQTIDAIVNWAVSL